MQEKQSERYFKASDSPPAAEREVHGAADMKFLFRCIREGAVARDNNAAMPAYARRLIIDFEKIALIEEALLTAKRELTPVPAPDILPMQDFSWVDETKDAMRFSMRTVYTSGLLSLEQFRTVGRIVSPMSTDYDYDLPGSGLFANQHVKVGHRGIVGRARGLQTLSWQGGIDLQDTDALRAATRSIAAHEFGHGMVSVLEAAGIPVPMRAGLIPADTAVLQLRQYEPEVRNEHVARAIEYHVERAALAEVLPLAVIDQYEMRRQDDHLETACRLEDFFTLAEQHYQFSPADLLYMDKEIQQRWGGGTRKPLLGVNGLLYYNVAPYTMDEVGTLFNGSQQHISL